MKKTIFVSLVLLTTIFGLIVGLASMKPNHYRIERKISIVVPIKTVFDELNNLELWQSWSPWKQVDPTIEVEFPGIKSGVGAVQKWKSKSSGDGDLEIISSDTPNSLRYKLNMDWGSVSIGGFDLSTGSDGQTQVIWFMEGDSKLSERIFWVLMEVEENIASDFDRGLSNLKTKLEKAADHN